MSPPAENPPDRAPEPPQAGEGRVSAQKAESRVQAVGARAASAVPTLDGADSLRPLPGDIRARLADLGRREAELRRREEEIAHQQQLLEEYAREVTQQEAERRRQDPGAAGPDQVTLAIDGEESRRRLVELARSLKAQQRRLTDQRATIEETLKTLQEREAVESQRRVELRQRLIDRLELIRQRKNEFVEKVRAVQTELKRRGTALARDRAMLEKDREALQRQRGLLEQRAADIEQRSQELDTRSETLERQHVVLAARDAELERRAESVAARESDLARQVGELDLKGAELRERGAELDARTGELDQRAAAQEAAAAQLGEQAHELAARQAELDNRASQIEVNEVELQQRGAELDARGRSLGEQREVLVERVDRLAERETALSERSAAVEKRANQTAERQAELEQQRASVDRLSQQAAETQQRAQRRDQEVAALQQRLEAREAELRREGLQLEVDRERVAQDQAALATEREKLADASRALEEQLSREPGVAPQESEPRAVRPPPSVPARTVVRRGLALCTAAGLVAAVVWLAVEQPRYRGLAQVRIGSARSTPQMVAGQHAEWLLSDAVAEHWQGPPAVETWRAAREAGRVQVRPLAQGQGVQLALEGADASLVEALLRAAVTAHSAYVRSLPLVQFRDSRLIEQDELIAALKQELAGRRDRLDEIRARLVQIPSASSRSAAEAAFEEGIGQFKDVIARLREQREALTALESQALPQGEVSPEEYQQRLNDDVMHQEDLKEFRSEARQCRSELAVSMVLLSDPLQELRKSVQELAATITEQRDLQPPPNVRVLLEECLAQVDDFNELLAEFLQSWQQRREAVERLDVSTQVVELGNHRSQATEAARRLVEEARHVIADVTTRIEGLGAKGDAGTREVVVTSVLRGDLRHVTEQVDALAEAAKATDPSVNIRLDAHDRQMRNLRTRLRQREGLVRQTLQADADRTARAGREEQEGQLQARIAELDGQRGKLVDALVTDLERVRELDARDQELREAVADQRIEEAAVSQLESRVAELEAQRPQVQRDTVELGAVRREQIAGVHRVRNAGMAGGAAFGVSGLLLLAMFARWPSAKS